MQVFINGKFTAQRTTGVQRVAMQLVQALDRAPEPLPGRWTLVCPPGAPLPPLRRIVALHAGVQGLPLHLWEQAVLPAVARRGLLVNLAGAAPWFGRRQVCLLHDAAVWDVPEAYRPLFRFWYRRLFAHLARSARALLTVSAFSRGRLCMRLGLAEARVQVVPNGGDHLDGVSADPAMLAGRVDLEGPFLLAVGSANPSKNLAALVQAFAANDRRQMPRLVIVGGGNAQVFAGAGAASSDPPGVVRLGPLDDAPLKALYQRATALVFPSLYEGFGLPALEAMACGCPVVAADAASLPEVCGDAALYVDPRSPDALAAALLQVATDGELRARLAAAGRARVAAFTWQRAGALLRTHVLAAGRV